MDTQMDYNDYGVLLESVKQRIRSAQTRAALSANAEMIMMYWDIGRMIQEKQDQEGWGSKVIPRMAIDLKNEFPEQKGFSERNLKRMIRFCREYSIVPQAAAQLQRSEDETVTRVQQSFTQSTDSHPDNEKVPQSAAQLTLQIPWMHNVVLWEKVKDLNTRIWYMEQCIANGWTRESLIQVIKSNAHQRQGSAVTNFDEKLPEPHANLATQTLKSPYMFDFLTIDEPFRERELELGLMEHLEKFLLELGQGFAFVGRQHHLEVSDNDFYLDLLFYHLKLRCFVVIDLKVGEFKPEYAGKMNFYCNVVDEQLKYDNDNPTIGLILCQDKDHIIAEYALRGMTQPIGVSEYELTTSLPEELKSSLPTIEQIEAQLDRDLS